MLLQIISVKSKHNLLIWIKYLTDLVTLSSQVFIIETEFSWKGCTSPAPQRTTSN